jgi:spermidine/putrescine transport system permease protein
VYFVFLFAPLFMVCVLAFNDSQFPALPWNGFTLEWFTADLPERVGIFHDSVNLSAIWVSFKVAFWVALIHHRGHLWRVSLRTGGISFKQALYFLMLAPLVIPGVILGISILLFANTLGMFFETPSIWTCPCSDRGSGWWCWVSFPLSRPW